MRRFRGEALPTSPRIAVVSNDAIGNYVVVTPLLQMLRERYEPSHLAYYSGPRTEEFWSQESLLDSAYSIFGRSPREVMAHALAEEAPDLVINVEWSAWAKAFTAGLTQSDTMVCGPCIGSDGRGDLPFADDDHGRLAEDREWIAPDLTTKYPFLRSGFIAEIFCRLAYLDGPIPPYRLPSKSIDRPIPDVLIAMSASLSEKLWPFENWRHVLLKLQRSGRTVGLLGAKPSSQSQFWLGSRDEQAMLNEGFAEDFRGQFSLPQVVCALMKAKAVLTIDNGILHLAASTQTPTIGLYREGIHRLWAPPRGNIHAITPAPGQSVNTIDPERVFKELCNVL